MTKRDLEDRLINFAVLIVQIVEEIPGTRSASHLSGQLLRSGTSPALHYGEAQGGESRRDFIHKLKIALKELRETLVCLRIIERSRQFASRELIERAIKENNELVAIFVKSAETAQRNTK